MKQSKKIHLWTTKERNEIRGKKIDYEKKKQKNKQNEMCFLK